MFADIQGFTYKSTQQTRDEIQSFIAEIRQLVQACIKKRNGNLVKTMGDGFLATFESPTDAVICGIEIQKSMEQRNAFVDDKRKKANLRIGINTGEVNLDAEGEIYGNAVNIAAKIQESAEPNKVFISETTCLAMNESELRTLNLEQVKLKGILKKAKTYKILKDLEENNILTKKEPFKAKKAEPSNNLRLMLIALILILLVILSTENLRKSPFSERYPQGENTPACQIVGIIQSENNPSVMIGRNAYFIGNLACGAKIKRIYQDRIIVEVKGVEKTYRIGETIASAPRSR